MVTINSSKKKVDSKPVAIFAGGHRVGQVRNGVFYKSVSGSKHFLRKPPSIALSVESIQQAQKFGAGWVEVFDRDTSTTYRASIPHILERGFDVNRGYEPQIGLVLEGWTKRRRGQPEQRSLFGLVG